MPGGPDKSGSDGANNQYSDTATYLSWCGGFVGRGLLEAYRRTTSSGDGSSNPTNTPPQTHQDSTSASKKWKPW